MRLLVTGGLGFIGSNFIRYILTMHKADSVINLDKCTYAANPESLKDFKNDKRYTFVEGDICDSMLVTELMAKADIIVHFAAESHVDRSIENSSDFIRTNVVGTQILLDAAVRSGLKRFHHISTDEVFGSLGDKGMFNEDSPYLPRSPYSASKAASDHLVRAYHHTHKLPITISNCSNNYGPYQYPEKVIPLFITNLIDEKKVPLYGKGNNVRDWIHVNDHNEAVDMIIRRGRIGETYCIGGDCEVRNIDLTLQIIKEFGLGDEMIEYVPDRRGHDYRYAIDSSKIKRELGWSQRHTFAEGVKETIKWYRDNEWWWRPLKEGEIK